MNNKGDWNIDSSGKYNFIEIQKFYPFFILRLTLHILRHQMTGSDHLCHTWMTAESQVESKYV